MLLDMIQLQLGGACWVIRAPYHGYIEDACNLFLFLNADELARLFAVAAFFTHLKPLSNAWKAIDCVLAEIAVHWRHF